MFFSVKTWKLHVALCVDKLDVVKKCSFGDKFNRGLFSPGILLLEQVLHTHVFSTLSNICFD